MTVEGESGAPGAVIITGASNATFNTYTDGGSGSNAYNRFRNVTFGVRVATNASAIRIDRTDRMELVNCYATAPTDATGSKFALHLVTSGAMSIANLTVEGGVYTGGVANSHAIFAQGVSGSGTVVGLTLRDVEASGILSALTLSGDVTNFLVEGGKYLSTGSAGIVAGQNSATAAGTLTGTLRGFVLDQSGSAGQALLLGAGCSGVVVEAFDLRAGNYGIMARSSTGSVIRDGTSRAGGHASAASGSAVYFRGATGSRVERCTLLKRAGVNGVVQVGADGAAAGTITCVDNEIVSYGGMALEWGTAGAAGDSGGSINDRNVYDLRGPAATLGSVYGTTGITTLGGLRTAWASYDVTTNDAKSGMAPATAEHYTPARAARLDAIPRLYYVATTGNDTSGDGSRDAPWATIAKAIASVASGDTVRIFDGTYAESTSGAGYLNLNRVFTAWTTFESESGEAEGVLIQGASDASLNVFTNADNAYFRFRNVTFSPRLATNVSAFRVSRTQRMHLQGCRLLAPTSNAATRYGFFGVSGSAQTIDHVTLEDCYLSVEGNSNAYGAFFQGQESISGLCTNLKLLNVEAHGSLAAVAIVGDSTDWEIEGGRYEGIGALGLRLGQDSETPIGTVTGEIDGATISTGNGTGHGLLIGCGCLDVVVRNADITGADYAVVLKESAGHLLRRITARGGAVNVTNGSAVYFKGATDCILQQSTLITERGSRGVIRVGAGDTGNESGTAIVTDNLVIAHGVKALEWADAAGDSGGSVCDRNQYDLRGPTASFGDVRGTTGITSLQALRTAWDGYDVPTNDERSVAVDVLDEPLADHLRTGSAGAALNGVSPTEVADIREVTERLETMLELDGAVYRFTTNALELGPVSPTVSTPLAASALAGGPAGTLTMRRGDTATLTITGLGSLAGRTKLWFTAKSDRDDADSAAMIQVEETAGLLRLAGAAATAGQGTLTVTDAAAGDVRVTLVAAAAAAVTKGVKYHWDVQMLNGSGVSTPGEGALRVVEDVTRAVS